MHDEMSDLAPALLLTVIVALGIVAFQFRSVWLETPAHAAKVIKVEKAGPQLAMTDRLYWIR